MICVRVNLTEKDIRFLGAEEVITRYFPDEDVKVFFVMEGVKHARTKIKNENRYRKKRS